MRLDSFYLEEEGIVFESFVDEPELEIPAEGILLESEEDKFDEVFDGEVEKEESSHHSRLIRIVHSNRSTNTYFDIPCPKTPSEEDGIPAAGWLRFEEKQLVMVDIDRLRAAGVPDYVISMIVDNQEELSRVRITRSSRIVLPDYRIEIKMPPLDKALYFLYLRHPEGIRFKELSDHRNELMDLYASITGREDIEGICASIDSLTDPLSNSVNEKCSRIKRAFCKAFSPELAKSYYIDGKSGEPKSIALDRDLVTWETLKPLHA